MTNRTIEGGHHFVVAVVELDSAYMESPQMEKIALYLLNSITVSSKRKVHVPISGAGDDRSDDLLITRIKHASDFFIELIIFFSIE